MDHPESAPTVAHCGDHPATSPPSNATRRWAQVGIWLALAVSVLDSSIANVALPSIAHDLGTSPSASIAIVTAFQMGAIAVLLPLATLGDVFTYRRVFLAGLALFTLSSLGCALSPTLPILVLTRALQGVGAAGIMSVNGALARHIFPSHRLGAALGSNALVVAIFGALGPTIASGILVIARWPWLFAINVPIGLLALIIGWRTLPVTSMSKHPLDIRSVIYNILACLMLAGGVELIIRGAANSLTVGILCGGTLAAGLLIGRSARFANPLFPLDLLIVRMARLSSMTSIATFCAQTMTLVYLPFYLQSTLALGLPQIGLLMTAWPLGVALAAPLAGWWADRMAVATIGGVGLLVMGTALLGVRFVALRGETTEIGALLGICGIGFGFFQAPNNRAIMSSAPVRRSGAAAGLIAMSRVGGQILGALSVALFLRHHGHSTSFVLISAAVLSLVAAGLSFSRGSADI
jgi:DHA2 family multidrug resistance protein-like MFS transporter